MKSAYAAYQVQRSTLLQPNCNRNFAAHVPPNVAVADAGQHREMSGLSLYNLHATPNHVVPSLPSQPDRPTPPDPTYGHVSTKRCEGGYPDRVAGAAPSEHPFRRTMVSVIGSRWPEYYLPAFAEKPRSPCLTRCTSAGSRTDATIVHT